MNFNQPDKEFRKEFFNLVETVDLVYITGHISVDDDSVSSTLAIYKIITQKYPNKKVKIVYTDQPTDQFKMFENFDQINFVPDIVKKIEKDSLLIMVDGSQYPRFSHQPEKLKNKLGKTICIDHHSSPPDTFDLSLIVPTIPSCAEIIYQTFSRDKEISKKLAEIYLLGILGDTGNFSYIKPEQAKTLSIAKKLIEIANIEIQEFQARYSTISKRVFEIVKEYIKNTQYHQIDGWPKFQTSYVSKEFKQVNSLTDAEISEGAHIYGTHYLRTITNYTWGFILLPRENSQGPYVTVSLRSLPNSVNVRDIMERMGIGGGHDRAAGGELESGNVKKCLEQMLTWIEKNKPEIS